MMANNSDVNWEQIFSNDYFMDRILPLLDIKSVSNCHCVTTDFLKAATREDERRRKVEHIHVLATNVRSLLYPNMVQLFDGFLRVTANALNMRPKEALILVSGQDRGVDYRKKWFSLKYLSQELPVGCKVTYIHVTSPLISKRNPRSLTNYDQIWEKQVRGHRRYCFPCNQEIH